MGMGVARIPGSPVHTVAKILEGLSGECLVVHDQEIGDRGARVDHIVVGQFGVLCLTARHERGRLTITSGECIAQGRRFEVASDARKLAASVSARLQGASGVTCSSRAVVVMIGAQLSVQGQPDGVTILTADALPLWLRSLPGVLDEVQVRELSAAAADPSTWKSKPPGKSRRASLFGGRQTPSAPSPAIPPPRAAVHDWALFETWVRTGERRFYVHDPDGRCLAFYDVKAGEMVLVNETVREFAQAVLAPHMSTDHAVRIDPSVSKRSRL